MRQSNALTLRVKPVEKDACGGDDKVGWFVSSWIVKKYCWLVCVREKYYFDWKFTIVYDKPQPNEQAEHGEKREVK